MKKPILLSAFSLVLSMLFFPACQKDPVQVPTNASSGTSKTSLDDHASTNLTQSTSQQPGATTTFTVNDVTDISFDQGVSCASDLVSLTGQIHTLYHITVNGNGDRLIIKTASNYEGVAGVSLISGVRYVGVGTTETTLSGVMSGGQFSYTAESSFKIVGQGPGNNYTVTVLFHITVNADLTLTSVVDKATIKCN